MSNYEIRPEASCSRHLTSTLHIVIRTYLSRWDEKQQSEDMTGINQGVYVQLCLSEPINNAMLMKKDGNISRYEVMSQWKLGSPIRQFRSLDCQNFYYKEAYAPELGDAADKFTVETSSGCVRQFLIIADINLVRLSLFQVLRCPCQYFLAEQPHVLHVGK